MNNEQAAAGLVRPGISPNAMSSLLNAVSAFRNLRAAAAMIGCALLALAVGAVLARLLAGVIGYTAAFSVAGLIGLVLASAGIHASGVLLMDQARQIPVRSMADAVVYGLMCVPKTIGVIVVMVVGVVALYIAMALLFWVCKLPGLGPFLFAIVLPVSVVISGLSVTALWLTTLIAMAAIWDGATVLEALGKAMAVLRERLVEAVLLVAVLHLLVLAVALFVAGVLISGFLPAAGMSAAIVGFSVPDISNLGALFGGGLYGFGEVGSYLMAGGFGVAALWMVGLTLVSLVLLMGNNLIYLRVIDGLDTSATQAALQAGLGEARRRAVEAGKKARESADRARADGCASAGASGAGCGRAAPDRGCANAASRTATATTGSAATVVPGMPFSHRRRRRVLRLVRAQTDCLSAVRASTR